LPSFDGKNHLHMDSPLSSQEIIDWTRRYTYATWRQQKGWTPLLVVDAEGCYFTDATGRL